MKVENSYSVWVILVLLVLIFISFLVKDYPLSDSNNTGGAPLTLEHTHHLYQSKILEHFMEPSHSDEDGSFWTPIEVDVSQSNPLVTFCQLKFKAYSAAPHVTVTKLTIMQSTKVI